MIVIIFHLNSSFSRAAAASLGPRSHPSFLNPFLAVIRSEETSGPITGAALSAVHKVISLLLLSFFYLFRSFPFLLLCLLLLEITFLLIIILFVRRGPKITLNARPPHSLHTVPLTRPHQRPHSARRQGHGSHCRGGEPLPLRGHRCGPR